MKLINTKRGILVKVDDELFEELNKYKWHIDKEGYIVRKRHEDNPVTKKLKIHRQIMGLAEVRGDVGVEKVDHRNGDRSDNRKCNLRISTQAQNVRNSRKRRGGAATTSRFKGVRWHKRDKRWEMAIVKDGKTITKYFKDEVAAAQAYDNLAIELHGEFACTNVDQRLY